MAFSIDYDGVQISCVTPVNNALFLAQTPNKPMKNLVVPFLIMAATIVISCKRQNNVPDKNIVNVDTATVATTQTPAAATIADAATILARREVPILCYHQIRNWRASDSKSAKEFIVPIDVFKQHMKILADSGYHTILPAQLYNYLTTGAPLPEKPIMLTFDDTDVDQYDVAWSEMQQYNFKGVFFIMTVSINRKPRYMSREQIEDLSRAGNAIELHTWNHEMVPSYKTDEKWEEQITKPLKKIEEITGNKSEYFAYPFGLWKNDNFAELKKRGVKAAFQLSTKRDENEPLYTIRRMIGSGYWSANSLYKSMIKTFNL